LFEEIYVKEFFKNPFFWWSAFILVLTSLHSFGPFSLILEMILLQKLYVPILYGCISLAIFLIVYPIRSRLRLLKNKREHQKEVIVYSLIMGILVAHALYFSSDPSVILTKLQGQIVTDKVNLEEILDLKMWAEYIAMPLVYAIAITQTRKILFKNEPLVFDNIKSGWKIAIISTTLGFTAYFIYVLLL